MSKNNRANRDAKKRRHEKRKRNRKTALPDQTHNFLSALRDSARWASLSVTFGEVSQELPELVESLGRFQWNSTIRLLAGLLTVPTYQAQTLRLEVLCGLAMLYCRGHSEPTLADVAGWYATIGRSRCVAGEDPAEDIFVDVVHLADTSYRILPGLWEAAAFHTQRVLEVLMSAPAREDFQRVRSEVGAILTVSEIVCGKAGLERYHPGGGERKSSLEIESLPESGVLASTACVTSAELAAAGVAPDDLEPFVVDRALVADLLGQVWGSSFLEDHPLLEVEDGFVLASPASVSVALRNHFIRFVRDNRFESAFDQSLAKGYARLFAHEPLLGMVRGARVPWQSLGGALLASVATEFDRGYRLALHFLLPSIGAHPPGGFAQGIEAPEQIEAAIQESVQAASREAEKEQSFRGGMHLVVACGWGLGLRLGLPPMKDPRWSLDILTAADLITMSEVEGMSPWRYWRMLAAKRELRAFGVKFANVNGPLNMLGWLESNDGRLVPHEQLPEDRVSPESPLLLVTQTDLLCGVRSRVAERHLRHMKRDLEGGAHFLQRADRGFFDIPADRRLFVCRDCVSRRRLVTAYEGEFTIWCSLETPNADEGDLALRLWEMLRVWLPRVGTAMAEKAPLMSDVALTIVFVDSLADFRSDKSPQPDQAWELAKLELLPPGKARITLEHGFSANFRSPQNIAERVIVSTMLRALLQLSGADVALLETILPEVVKNEYARNFHLFTARSYSDYVAAPLPGSLLVGDPIDFGRVRLGLGWRAHNGSSLIQGALNCRKLLNDVVGVLVDDIRGELAGLNRVSTIGRLVLNHAKAQVERERWIRTSKALLALYGARDAMEAVVSELSEKSGAMVLSRCLVEFAVCECPLSGGRDVADGEIERLLCMMSLLVQIGGMSDGVYYGVLEPNLRISALGDILIVDELGEEVVEPMFQRVIGDSFIEGASGQDRNYSDALPIKLSRDSFEPEFWDAWTREMGFDIDEARSMIDQIENAALKAGSHLFQLSHSALLALVAQVEGRDKARSFLNRFTLPPREQWDSPPEGAVRADIYPWRFGRKLSLVSRPIVQLDHGDDPAMLVSPPLLRTGFVNMVASAHQGILRDGFFRTDSLGKVWKEKAQEGHAFTAHVAQSLRSAGWQVRDNLELSEVLQRKLPKDYGDVDVLAWRTNSNAVLVIECKDLNARRNYSEIAAQLSDYQGREKNGRKDKLLKHLSRFELLEADLNAVSKFTGVPRPELSSCLVVSGVVPMQYAKVPALASTYVGSVEELIERERGYGAC